MAPCCKSKRHLQQTIWAFTIKLNFIISGPSSVSTTAKCVFWCSLHIPRGKLSVFRSPLINLVYELTMNTKNKYAHMQRLKIFFQKRSLFFVSRYFASSPSRILSSPSTVQKNAKFYWPWWQNDGWLVRRKMRHVFSPVSRIGTLFFCDLCQKPRAYLY